MYRVYTINKVTGYRQEVVARGMTEYQAESFCESWGWNYSDEQGRSYWLDYESEDD